MGIEEYRSFTAGKFTYEGFLFRLNLHERLIFYVVPFQLCFFLVEIVVQFHHLSLSVFCLTLPFIAFSQSPQFLFFDLYSKLVQTFSQGRHVFVHRDDFGDELHGQTFEVIWFSELFRVQDSDVVFFIEGDGKFVCHIFKL